MKEANLKQKTVKGFFWSAVDSAAGQGINFIVLIILANILDTSEFGLIGLTTVFVAIAQVFIDGGLNYALIRKQDCTDLDYSTSFYFNIGVGIIVYLILFICAPFIAHFFYYSALTSILRIVGLCLIIGSFTSVQQTILIKNVDFKSQAIISLLASTISGVIAIYMAFVGFGVWALVWRLLINQGIRSILLWIHNKWTPLWIFSKDSFKNLFFFGYKVMLVYLLASIAKNIYTAVIGRFYTKDDVGYYSTSDQYAGTAGGILSIITSKVTYPVFSALQNDKTVLKGATKKTLESIMFITFHIMFLIIVIAKPLIIILTGVKWEPSVIYLQALCLAYVVSPMHSVNQNIMNALGRSDLFLRTEIFKYLLFIPIILIGIFLGLKALIVGFIIHWWLGFFANAWYSKKLINYSIFEQLKSISSSAIIAFTSMGFAFLFHYFISFSSLFLELFISLTIFILTSLTICLIFKPTPFQEALSFIRNRGFTKLN